MYINLFTIFFAFFFLSQQASADFLKQKEIIDNFLNSENSNSHEKAVYEYITNYLENKGEYKNALEFFEKSSNDSEYLTYFKQNQDLFDVLKNLYLLYQSDQKKFLAEENVSGSLRRFLIYVGGIHSIHNILNNKDIDETNRVANIALIGSILMDDALTEGWEAYQEKNKFWSRKSQTDTFSSVSDITSKMLVRGLNICLKKEINAQNILAKQTLRFLVMLGDDASFDPLAYIYAVSKGVFLLGLTNNQDISAHGRLFGGPATFTVHDIGHSIRMTGIYDGDAEQKIMRIRKIATRFYSYITNLPETEQHSEAWLAYAILHENHTNIKMNLPEKDSIDVWHLLFKKEMDGYFKNDSKASIRFNYTYLEILLNTFPKKLKVRNFYKLELKKEIYNQYTDWDKEKVQFIMEKVTKDFVERVKKSF